MSNMQSIYANRCYRSLVLTLIGVFLVGCDSSAPTNDLDGAVLDAEVARRVAQIEMEQRLNDLEQKLEQQVLTVEEKDRLIEDQRLLLAEKNRTETSTSTPVAPVTSPTNPSTAGEFPRTTATDVGVDANADYSVFYEQLEPHGTWFETQQFGAIWQPAERYTPVGWQPYTRGSWTYADVGWTWVSTEPFGWATYHYGRWSNISNRGWCWIPGNQWAPAWVSWRTGSDFVGWSPLPAQTRFRGNRIGVQVGIEFDSGPGNYCFVPSRYFGSSSVYRHVVPVEQNNVIISNTTNVTNIIRDNDIVINQGPDYNALSRASVSPIRTARVVRQPKTPQGNTPGVNWSGNQLNVAAPIIKAATPAQRVVMQRAERINRLEAVNGWEQIQSPVERQRLREQLSRQNQREQTRMRAIASTQGGQEGFPPAPTTAVVPKMNSVEQRAQQEVQARRLAAQRERERQMATKGIVATPSAAGSSIAQPVARQTPQTQAQREVQQRRETAQAERERLAKVAAARQQAAMVQQTERQQAAIAKSQPPQRVQQPVAVVRPTAQNVPKQSNAAQNQAIREAQARREQAHREREQQERAAAARQQAAINQRQAQVARQTAIARSANQPPQRPKTSTQRPPAQTQRPDASSQPSASQIQAMRQAQARREAAQAEREQAAKREEQNQKRAQAQRQQLALQRQSQNRPVNQPPTMNAAQRQRIEAAQRQRQLQIQQRQQ